MYDLHKGHDPRNVGFQRVPKDIIEEIDRKSTKSFFIYAYFK